MPAYISIATDDDAGEWAAVLPFLHFKVCDYAPGDRAELLAPPALVSASFHTSGVAR